MENVNALSKKMDDLMALKNQQCYWESSLLIFCETWITSHVPDASFTTVRADQDTNTCRKSKGGILILYVNKGCATGDI